MQMGVKEISYCTCGSLYALCVLETDTDIDKKITHSITGDSSNRKRCKGPLNY